jgi:hypothetical protein
MAAYSIAHGTMHITLATHSGAAPTYIPRLIYQRCSLHTYFPVTPVLTSARVGSRAEWRAVVYRGVCRWVQRWQHLLLATK